MKTSPICFTVQTVQYSKIGPPFSQMHSSATPRPKLRCARPAEACPRGLDEAFEQPSATHRSWEPRFSVSSVPYPCIGPQNNFWSGGPLRRIRTHQHPWSTRKPSAGGRGVTMKRLNNLPLPTTRGNRDFPFLQYHTLASDPKIIFGRGVP